jgi:hypothetical protein
MTMTIPTMVVKKKKEDATRTSVMVILFVYLTFLPSFTTAWGELGHEIVANLAWHRLTLSTQDTITQLLNITNITLIDETGSPLAAVANWADQVRHFMPWSAELHYIDIHDNLITGGCHYSQKPEKQQPLDDDSSMLLSLLLPCNDCVFEYDRDCPKDICVAGAILNYSTQLVVSRSKKKIIRKQKLPPHYHLRLRHDDYPPGSNSFGSTSPTNQWKQQQQKQEEQQQALKFLIQ